MTKILVRFQGTVHWVHGYGTLGTWVRYMGYMGTVHGVHGYGTCGTWVRYMWYMGTWGTGTATWVRHMGIVHGAHGFSTSAQELSFWVWAGVH